MDLTRYKSTFGFIDLLMNLLVGFVCLFILAFFLINPIAKKDVLDPKAEYMFIIEWNDKSPSDIDIWIKDNIGTLVSFQNKDKNLISIDRDDLGTRNDVLNEEKRNVNREVVTIKSKLDRVFLVSVYFYHSQEYNPPPEPIKIEVIQVNPYQVLRIFDLVMEMPKQEKPAFGMRIEAGHVTFFEHNEMIASKHALAN